MSNLFETWQNAGRGATFDFWRVDPSRDLRLVETAMFAMRLAAPGEVLRPAVDIPTPVPGAGQVLVRVLACGVCRTDLHVCDGDLPPKKSPLTPGHEIVGRIEAIGTAPEGRGTSQLRQGQLVGIPWLGHVCERCRFCLAGKENLCDAAQFTGYTVDGGYAQYTVADEQFCFALPETGSAASLAPFLCAGLIGWRSLKLAGAANKLGVYGFGAAAHIIAQVAVAQGREVYAFTRGADERSQNFARSLGCVWAGGSEESPPHKLDAAIIFAPVGALVPLALRAIDKGGVLVCGGIHMSDIPAFPYSALWEERSIRSVANLTRADGVEFFDMLAKTPVKTSVHEYDLKDANQALDDLRCGRFNGAAVLVPAASTTA